VKPSRVFIGTPRWTTTSYGCDFSEADESAVVDGGACADWARAGQTGVKRIPNSITVQANSARRLQLLVGACVETRAAEIVELMIGKELKSEYAATVMARIRAPNG